MPAIRSSRSGLAPTSAGLGRTGRRLANRPIPLRRPSRPCSGRGRVGVGGVPLRPADGAEQDRVGGAAGVQHLVGEGGAVLVDRDAADQALVELELAQGLEQAAGGADDLGADPVAGQDDYAGASLIGAAL